LGVSRELGPGRDNGASQGGLAKQQFGGAIRRYAAAFKEPPDCAVAKEYAVKGAIRCAAKEVHAATLPPSSSRSIDMRV
jgi:hypothetical protein